MASPDEPLVLTERRGTAQLITINRLEKLNAMTPDMGALLAEAIKAANQDPNVGAIVVTGVGRAFCAGADMSVFERRRDREGRTRQPLLGSHDWVGLIRESKPVLAAINGLAVGIGTTLALPMDIIFASPEARLCFNFVRLGIVPELASSHFLVSRVGFGAASEMMLTGRIYGGEEAHALGLVDRLVSHDDLIPRALHLAHQIAENPDPQLRMTKSLLTRNGAETDLKAVQHRESEALAEALRSAEHKEAVRAFIEKRPAKFR